MWMIAHHRDAICGHHSRVRQCPRLLSLHSFINSTTNTTMKMKHSTLATPADAEVKAPKPYYKRTTPARRPRTREESSDLWQPDH